MEDNMVWCDAAFGGEFRGERGDRAVRNRQDDDRGVS
jgi:hypothetical protein